MVERSIAFWEKYGPITVDGFDFEPNGYTETVDTGDGDYLTEDTLWDFKVSKQKPTSKHTLQLLMYWIMGQHTGKAEFKNIKKLGFFNPRRNAVYIFPVELIPEKTIRTIEDEVICYNRFLGDRITIFYDYVKILCFGYLLKIEPINYSAVNKNRFVIGIKTGIPLILGIYYIVYFFDLFMIHGYGGVIPYIL